MMRCRNEFAHWWAITKTLLSSLQKISRIPTVSLENFDSVIAECKSEGLIVESISVRETVLYTWRESAVEVTR